MKNTRVAWVIVSTAAYVRYWAAETQWLNGTKSEDSVPLHVLEQHGGRNVEVSKFGAKPSRQSYSTYPQQDAISRQLTSVARH